jgi:hypothetical protein
MTQEDLQKEGANLSLSLRFIEASSGRGNRHRHLPFIV